MQCKAFECVAFDGDSTPPAVVLFWRKAINSTEIFEEHLSAAAFELLQTTVHPLLWASGSEQVERDETTVLDLTENVSLNTRNSSEIQKATDRMKSDCTSSESVGELGVEEKDGTKEPNNVDNEGKTGHGNGADNMSALGMGGVEDNDDNNTYYDGNEKITVHTDHCPVAVLNSERKLVEHLAVLYDIRSGVASKSITVGGHAVELYPFHYPDQNLEAPKNDKQRTYVDPTDLPSLFAYDWKNALCTRAQRVSEDSKSINLNV